MKAFTDYINEGKSDTIKFNNTELLNQLLSIKNNKEYKKEKINYVKVIEDRDEEAQIEIETSFATYIIDLFIEDDNTLTIGGDLSSTAYDEVDELLEKLYDSNSIGEFSFHTETDWDNNTIIDELFNQMNQDKWSGVFKFLHKTYNTLEKLYDTADDTDCIDLFKSMIETYSKI